MTEEPEFIYGVFRQEIKNRFLCSVEIDGETVTCYVPSSCRLSNFLDMTDRSVMLTPITNPKARTRLALYTVKGVTVSPLSGTQYRGCLEPIPGRYLRMCDGLLMTDRDIINCQTFPQDYDFMDQSVQYNCGMSVPPVMMAKISEQVYRQWLKGGGADEDAEAEEI